MQLNTDFSRRAVVHSAALPWVASPMPGVERRMLDRVGGEVARATSIVRYAPGSAFAAHVHGGGEEFLVLDGVFQDESGDYSAGTYVRNPPQSSHTPRSELGCTIFVKLWQFEPADRRHVVVDTSGAIFTPVRGRDGVAVVALYHDSVEDVRLERWRPGSTIELSLPGGGEFLVLEGSFEEHETFGATSWLRLPPGATLHGRAGADGCTVWVKTGHLTMPRGLPPGDVAGGGAP